MRSPHARLIALIRTYDRENKLDLGGLSKVASQLNLFEPCNEPVFAWKELKSSGKGWRSLCMFGLRRRAAQIIVRDILDAKFGTDPLDEMRRGAGCDRSSDRIVMEMSVYSHWICVDLANYYGSVGQEGVIDLLGLPKAVVTNYVFAPVEVVKPLSVSPHTLGSPLWSDEAVRLGLPQGSLVSPMIAGLLLGPTLRSIIAADQVRFYGDDILIGTSSLAEAKKVVLALNDAFKAHPAGPFPLRRCDIMSNLSGFEFTKYKFRAAYGGQKIRRLIAPRSRLKFRRKLAGIGASELTWPEKLKAAERYTRRWVASFPRAHRNKDADYHDFETYMTIVDLSHRVATGEYLGLSLADIQRKLRRAIRGNKS